MKYVSYVTTVAVASLFVSVHAVELSRLQESAIADKKAAVESIIARNKREKCAFYALAASAVGGAVYYAWPAQSDPDQLVTLTRKQLETLVSYVKDGAKAAQEAADAVKTPLPDATPVATPDVQPSPGLFRSLYDSTTSAARGAWGLMKDFTVWSAKTGWQGAVSSLMLHHMINATRFPERYTRPFQTVGERIEHKMNSLYDRLFFEPTLSWYIGTQTHLKETFIELYYRASVLDTRKVPQRSLNNFLTDETVTSSESSDTLTPLPVECVASYCTQLSALWDACVRDIEGIVGFLRYKQSVDAQSGINYQQTSEAIIDLVTTSVGDIERLLTYHEQGKRVTGLAEKVQTLSRLLQVECDTCVIFEQAA